MHCSGFTRLLPIGVLVCGLACGSSDGDKNNDTNEPGIALSLTPASATVIQGQTTAISVAIARVALSGTNVALAVTGAPTGVTAVVSPESTTADTAQLTLTASETAAPGTASLIVTATADGGPTATATFSLTVNEPAPITVNGVFTNAFGVPFPASSIVHVWGHDATTAVETTTALNGTFTAASIRPPYDVVFVVPTIGTRVFMGLTSPTPALSDLFDQAYAAPTVAIGGTTTPLSNDNITIVTAVTGNGGEDVTFGGADPDTYTMSVSPPASGTTLNATMAALQMTKTGNMPTAYTGFDQKAVVLDIGGPNTVDFTLAPIASNPVTVRALNSAGGPASQITLAWLNNRKLLTLGVADLTSSDTEVVRAPADERIQIAIQATVISGKTGAVMVKNVTPTTTAVNLQLPPGLTTVTPADAAIDVTDSASFSANDVPGSTYYFTVKHTPTFDMHVITPSPEVSLARLRAIGAGLPSGTSFVYQVIAVFGPGTDPFGPARLSLYELGRSDGGGYRAAVNHTFATQ